MDPLELRLEMPDPWKELTPFAIIIVITRAGER
jgi:hypothetical protein